MKKLISGMVLGLVLLAGVFFTVNTEPDDLTWGERHPPIFKPLNVEKTL